MLGYGDLFYCLKLEIRDRLRLHVSFWVKGWLSVAQCSSLGTILQISLQDICNVNCVHQCNILFSFIICFIEWVLIELTDVHVSFLLFFYIAIVTAAGICVAIDLKFQIILRASQLWANENICNGWTEKLLLNYSLKWLVCRQHSCPFYFELCILFFSNICFQ